MRSQQGFTLIEIIATLLISGVLIAIAGMGIVAPVQSFFFARENAEMVQKVDYAINRITMELINLNEITAATTGSMTYTTTAQGLTGSRTLRVNNSQVLINDNPLIDNIGSYGARGFLNYRKFDNTVWNLVDGLANLAAVDVLLVFDRQSDDVENQSFQATVVLRNNRLFNAPMPGT